MPLYARQVIIQQTIHIKNNGEWSACYGLLHIQVTLQITRSGGFDLTRTASYDIEYQG